MTILITGGTGFLGPVLAEELLRKSNEKIILLDLSPKKIDFLEKYGDSVKIVEGDITDSSEIFDLCKKLEVDRIVHLAAIADVDVAEKNPLQATRVNVDGACNVFETCRRLDMKVLFASTGAVYGKSKGPVSEDSPYNPADIYGATKVMGEVMGLQYVKSYNIDLIINRLYFIYGARMFFEPISPFGMVKNAVDQKPTSFERGRDQPFDFTHVRDTARGIVSALLTDSKELKHNIFNISSGKTTTLGEIARIVKKYVPESDIRIGPGKLDIQRGFPLDISRAREELGYEPEVSLDDGIKETIMWLRRRP